jgi:hypothetical protein
MMLITHGRNGRIRDSDSYGNDPFVARFRPTSRRSAISISTLGIELFE